MDRFSQVCADANAAAELGWGDITVQTSISFTVCLQTSSVCGIQRLSGRLLPDRCLPVSPKPISPNPGKVHSMGKCNFLFCGKKSYSVSSITFLV